MQYRKVIFLDIDGTLNDNSWRQDDSAPWILREPAAALHHIVQETGAQIILSSQRRANLHTGRISLSGFQVLLKSHGCKANVAGYLTYTDNWADKKFLIRDWLRVNTWKHFAIIDDVDMECPNQVFTDPKTGLTFENALEAIQILNGDTFKPLDSIKQTQTETGIELE